jgi:ubiquinone/menaquinone biosynthesis C-methylase UbiE
MLRILFVLALSAFISPVFAQSYDGDPWIANCSFWERSRDKTWKYLYGAYDSLQFQPGERIADIGARGATLAGILSMFYDNIDLTLEDIDSTCLGAKFIAYSVEHYRKVNGGTTAKNNTFHVVIGTETSTTLPDTAFRKVFFINTFHEVSKQAEMLRDLYRILAPGGTLYVEEKVATKKKIRRKDCGHIMPIESELLTAFQSAGFRLKKTNITERMHRRGDRVKMAWYQFAK